MLVSAPRRWAWAVPTRPSRRWQARRLRLAASGRLAKLSYVPTRRCAVDGRQAASDVTVEPLAVVGRGRVGGAVVMEGHVRDVDPARQLVRRDRAARERLTDRSLRPAPPKPGRQPGSGDRRWFTVDVEHCAYTQRRSMTSPQPPDWDASRYHRVAQPHAAWGANVLDRLRLGGDELVLDAGCGSGKVTAQLLERLPRGRVIGADLSPAMLAEARTTLAAFDGRVTFVQTDLLEIDAALADSRPRTPSSRRRRSTGSTTTRACSPRCTASSSRAAGSCRSSAAAATWPASCAPPTPSRSGPPMPSICRASRCGASTIRPSRRASGCEQAGFSDVDAWLEPSPQTFKDAASLGDFAARRRPAQPSERPAARAARRVRRRGHRRDRAARRAPTRWTTSA